MKMNKSVSFLLYCLLSVFSTSIYAQMMVPVSLEQRAKMAQKIVLGKVVEKFSYWDDARHNIYTTNIMEIEAYLKNDVSNNVARIAVITAGGIVGNEGQITCPSFEFVINNEYAVFLDADNKNIDNKTYRQAHPTIAQCEPYASSQGVLGYLDGMYYDLMVEKPMTETAFFNKMQSKFNLTASTPTGIPFTAREIIIINSSTLGGITGWTNGGGTLNSTGNYIGATVVAANELIINGNGFGAAAGTVEFDHINDGVGIGALTYAPTIASDIVSWSDAQIRVKIPSNAGTGIFRVKDNTTAVVATSATNINIIWSQINVATTQSGFTTDTRQQTRFINQTGGGYAFQYSTINASGNTFSTNNAAKASFERALATWRCATRVNFRVSSTTTNVGTGTVADNINVVAFATLSAGVLGGCTTRFGIQSVPGNCTMFNTLIFVSELDIELSQNAAGLGWNYGPGATSGGAIDFESVMLHEVGHGHSCAHINNTATTMYFNIGTNTDKRTLSANEITCGDFRVSNSTSNFCVTPFGGKTPMVRIGAASCGNALPLKLLTFTATAKKQSTKNITWLNWKTANEVNVAQFEIERANEEGLNFKKIKIINATNSLNQNYEAEDENPFVGINFYRLKMVDIDGSFTYSFIQKVVFEKPNNKIFSVYPNPARQSLFINFTDDVQSKNKSFSIINFIGQTYLQGIIINNKIDIESLPTGTFIIKIGEEKATFFKQ